MDSRWHQALEQLDCATVRLEAAGEENLPLLEDALNRCEAATAGIGALGEPPASTLETLRVCLGRMHKATERIRVASARLRQDFARYSQMQSLAHSLAGSATDEKPRISRTG